MKTAFYKHMTTIAKENLSYVRESVISINFLTICQLNFEPFYITYISACLAHFKFLPNSTTLTYDSANKVSSVTEYKASNTQHIKRKLSVTITITIFMTPPEDISTLAQWWGLCGHVIPKGMLVVVYATGRASHAR
jgi:hypothetical protein